MTERVVRHLPNLSVADRCAVEAEARRLELADRDRFRMQPADRREGERGYLVRDFGRDGAPCVFVSASRAAAICEADRLNRDGI